VDGLDRLTQEQGPEGTVGYTYDAAGRRMQMTVTGQSNPVGYTYDNDDRLTGIAQGSTANVAFTYDVANRRTSLTLPNGVEMSYSYDSGSELTGINYQLAGASLGNLTYAYDADGRRTQVGGSWASTGMPLPVSTTAYNAANELTQWGTANLFYDANGNMTSDGTNSFTWDARNQLASVNSGIDTFQYDPFGRRLQKVINGTATSFLYDGLNPVQELSGTTVTANLLTGLSVDEYLARTDASGTSNFLADALGSTLALADPTGTVQTQYTYDPFGSTTLQGAANANSYQFTGRENDGTGLYYYRARYYNPPVGRFISQDPTGFSGGINLYAYSGDDPLGDTDPNGTGIVDCAEALAKLAKATYDLNKDLANDFLRGGCPDPGQHKKEIAQRKRAVEKALEKVKKHCSRFPGAPAAIIAAEAAIAAAIRAAGPYLIEGLAGAAAF
jgi:RHS repeat-associated protein